MAFYKEDDGVLLEAPTFVSSKDYELDVSKHETYDLPIDGWHWFETREEALSFFSIKEPSGV